MGNKLLAQEMYGCQQKNIVLCIEVLSSSHDSINRRKRETADINIEDYNNDK